jgi:FMN phosphatase YigB (HAD superfamily)
MEATRRLGVLPAETWFVGDGADEELSGAERAGLLAFRALWFLRRWPHFREEAHYPASVESVDDVLALVARAKEVR